MRGRASGPGNATPLHSGLEATGRSSIFTHGSQSLPEQIHTTWPPGLMNSEPMPLSSAFTEPDRYANERFIKSHDPKIITTVDLISFLSMFVLLVSMHRDEPRRQ